MDLIKVLKVDISKAEPSIWVDEVKELVRAWHSDTRNRERYLGLKFLSDTMEKELGLSQATIGNIIKHMTDSHIMELRIDENEHKSYYLVEDE